MAGNAANRWPKSVGIVELRPQTSNMTLNKVTWKKPVTRPLQRQHYLWNNISSYEKPLLDDSLRRVFAAASNVF